MSNWWDTELEESGDDWWDTVSIEHQTWWVIEGGESSTWWQLGSSYEEGEWVPGVQKSLPIEWYEILAYVPVETDKEIISIDFEPQTLDHIDGGHFDLFSIARSLMMDKLYGPEEEMICLEEVSAGDIAPNYSIPLFGAPQDRTIEGVWILPEADSAAGAGDEIRLAVYNETADSIICTATIRTGDDQLSAWELRQFAGVANLREGTGVSLRIDLMNGSAFDIPRSIIIIQWDIADFGEE